MKNELGVVGSHYRSQWYWATESEASPRSTFVLGLQKHISIHLGLGLLT